VSAIEWLRADLRLRLKIVESGKPEERQIVAAALQHWQNDADLAGLRGPKELQKLPAEERDSCHKLWADVEGLLEQVTAKP
jgi:hypothetical protein